MDHCSRMPVPAGSFLDMSSVPFLVNHLWVSPQAAEGLVEALRGAEGRAAAPGKGHEVEAQRAGGHEAASQEKAGQDAEASSGDSLLDIFLRKSQKA